MGFSVNVQKQDLYLENGSWTVPYGATAVTFECWGGGGSGAQSDGFGGGGGGGGGGAYAKKIVFSVQSGSDYKIIVGSGGKNSNGQPSYVLPPGESSISNCICVAYGGYGGTNQSAGMTCISGSIGDIVYSGGTGGDGIKETMNDYGGGGGEGAGTTSNGNNAVDRIGGTGGNGGDGGNGYLTSPTTTAESGDDYGGGGGGGMSTTAGHGGDGKVIVTYDIIENQLLNITAAYF